MKKIKLLCLLTVFTVLLVACAKDSTPTPVEPTRTLLPTSQIEPTVTPADTKPDEEVKDVYTLTVNLKKGLKWSDGTPFTAQDIVGTYNIFWAQQGASWSYLVDVMAKDDHTVDFILSEVSAKVIYYILDTNIIRPYTPYAEFADEAAKLRAAGVDPESDEVKALLEQLNTFRPEDYIVSGPFKIAPEMVTESQLIMEKNPNGYNADEIEFDTVTMFYGETDQVVPLVMSGDVDYATHAFTPAQEEAFPPAVDIVRSPTGFGPGLWFNQALPIFQKTQVRQAIAYVIDREENGVIAMGKSGEAIEYMAGFPDSAVPEWLSSDTIAKLDFYEQDWDKAEALLTSAGFVKDNKGNWLDAEGEVLSFEISVPDGWIDFVNTALNAADQLREFGMKVSVRTYPAENRFNVQKDAEYDILVDVGIIFSPPHPYRSFEFALTPPFNNPNDKGEARGMNWAYTTNAPDGEQVTVAELIRQAALGMDPAKQKPYIETLALTVNEQLPILYLWERLNNNPINTQSVNGWPDLQDDIYNNQGSDNFVAVMLLNGTLYPSDRNSKKDFGSAWPYPQPPLGHFNLFTSDSLPVNVGVVAYPLQFPPLFWYRWTDAKYVPVLAESYELK